MKKSILILAAFVVFIIVKDEYILPALFGTDTAVDIVADDSPVSGKWENAPGFYAKKLRVQDGDGLVVKGKRHIRLLCIDAPEKEQDYGDAATASLEKLVKNGAYISTNGKDQYGRTLAIVIVNIDGKQVIANYEMIRQGYAWVYRKFSKTCGLDEEALYAMERKAKEEKRGLWQSPDPIYPGKWKYDNRK